MKYTFSEAKRRLRQFAGSSGARNTGEVINTAIEALAASKDWLDLKRIVRVTTRGEYFAMPQEYGNIVRAAVNGTPVSMRSRDYEFLHSGPGDLDYLSDGYQAIPQTGIQDLGTFPTMFSPHQVERICAFSTAGSTGKVRVRGRNAFGDLISETISITEWVGPDSLEDANPMMVEQTGEGFTEITELVLPPDVSEYVSIYGITGGEFCFLSRMHPAYRAAEFRRYRLPSFNKSSPSEGHHILAEVRMKFVPMVDDDDILPFDTLLPVQYMMQSLNYADSQELEAAEKYRNTAFAFLSQHEDVKYTQQGILVVNTLYDNSLGAESDYNYDNI